MSGRARAKWENLYRKKKEDDDEVQTCAVCGLRGNKSQFSPHHTRGRSGENILRYIYVCELPCHRQIHANPAWAKSKGFLETRL